MPLTIWNSITVFTISNSDLAPKSIQELFYLKNHWCKRKKSVFIWINFSRKKIVIFRFVNTVNFFKSAVKKTWIESGHLNFFLIMYYSFLIFLLSCMLYSENIEKEIWILAFFLIANTCKNLVFSIVKILIRKIVN